LAETLFREMTFLSTSQEIGWE